MKAYDCQIKAPVGNVIPQTASHTLTDQVGRTESECDCKDI